MTKTIQVFIKGESSAELSAELLKLQFKNNCAWITFREEDYKGTTIFPLANVSMIRLIDEKDEE